MTEPLATKYRPTSFQEIVGQRHTAVILSQMVEKDAVPLGLLFSGPSGSGKTTVARILAHALGSDLDIIEIDAASNGGVSEVRSLIERLRYSSGGEHRIIIIDEAHSMSRDAFNALLKTLEEPPSGAVFVLVTTEPEKLPEVVLTRLIDFSFSRVSPSDIFDRLVVIASKEGIEMPMDLLQLVAEHANGNVRAAIMTLDKLARAGVNDVESYVESLRENDFAPALVAALMTGDAELIYSQIDELFLTVSNPASITANIVHLFSELWVLRSGGTIRRSGVSLAKRKELALRLESERIFAAAKLLWDLKTRIRVTDDARGNLELALMLIAEVFTRGKQIPQKEAPSVPPQPIAQPVESRPVEQKKLSLGDLQRRKGAT